MRWELDRRNFSDGFCKGFITSSADTVGLALWPSLGVAPTVVVMHLLIVSSFSFSLVVESAFFFFMLICSGIKCPGRLRGKSVGSQL